MELSDRIFVTNKDWDPQYLREMVSQDFYEFKELWQNGIGDGDLVKATVTAQRYEPTVEDISMDDTTLYDAVAEIERELETPDCSQFFQFDSQGNMFIFAPGAGCTGEAKLVRPGDELIFSSTYDWEQREGPSIMGTCYKDEGNLTLTCPATPHTTGHEFKPPLTEEALVDLTHKNFSPETIKTRSPWALCRAVVA